MIPAKLNYSTYCVHYMIITMVMDYEPEQLFINWYVWMNVSLVAIFWSYFVGWVVYMLWEAPFAELSKILLQKVFDRKKEAAEQRAYGTQTYTQVVTNEFKKKYYFLPD